MKKFAFMYALMAMFCVTAMAQTPWKILDMEDVTRHGSNADYDDETTTVTFKGDRDRWIDLPGLKGDLTGHTTLEVNIEKSDVILKFAIRYKDANGKTQQHNGVTLWGRMGKAITKPTKLKVDLTNKGKIEDDIFKDVVSIRVAMAKACTDKTEPWEVKFGEVVVY